MTFGRRRALAIVAVSVLCSADCANDPTAVNVTVDVDATVPPYDNSWSCSMYS